MTDNPDQTSGKARPITISVDAMGGDRGPAAVVAGIKKSAEKNPDIAFLVHGPESELKPLVEKSGLADRCQIRNVTEVVTMDAKPSHVMRNGKNTSMPVKAKLLSLNVLKKALTKYRFRLLNTQKRS